MPGFDASIWCGYKDQEVLRSLDGFVPVPPRSHAPHRFFNSSAVALPDAAFNALLCTSIVRPARPAILHIARGRHALGRCDPFWNPWRRNRSKASVLRMVQDAGLAAGIAACCGGYPALTGIAQSAGDDVHPDELVYRGMPKRHRDPRVRAAVRLLNTIGRATAAPSVQ